eukprot:m.149892 g.149892  ORF g.149892 m.149892 type:complete len:101 (+) comp52785_c3_seq27:609-911(+)
MKISTDDKRPLPRHLHIPTLTFDCWTETEDFAPGESLLMLCIEVRERVPPNTPVDTSSSSSMMMARLVSFVTCADLVMKDSFFLSFARCARLERAWIWED